MQVRIPATLRKFTEGADTLPAAGATVGEVLAGLCERYPDFRPRLFKPDGSLNRFVNVFVNEEDIRFTGDLQTPVKENDEISIIQAVAGG
ncbi:MAG: MoaD/ThiS family protein [Phycisphaerae bacterium]